MHPHGSLSPAAETRRDALPVEQPALGVSWDIPAGTGQSEQVPR